MEQYGNLTDEQLVSLVKARDHLAFTEIYQRHWHTMYLHTYKVLGDLDEAKDLVQDVFFSFWEKALMLDIRTNIKGYLYIAARNRIFSLIRKRKVNEQFIDLMLNEMDELDYTTVREIDEQELMALIDAEIARLPPKMRRVFELSRKQFLTHKEIAEKLGMSEEAVKKHIHRSIKLLKSKLGHYVGFYLLLATVVSCYP